MRMNIIRHECIHLLSSKIVTYANSFTVSFCQGFLISIRMTSAVYSEKPSETFWSPREQLCVMQMALSMLREAVSRVHSFVGLRSRAKEKKKRVYVLCNFKKCQQLPWFISFMCFYCHSYCTTAALWLRGINYVRLYADYLLLRFVNNINSCALLTLAWLRLCLGPTNPAAASGKKIY